MDIREIAADYADMIREEYDLDELYVSDVIYEVIDGASEVTYTHESMALVESLSTEELDNAEVGVETECAGTFMSYYRHVQLIAYFALEAAIYEQFTIEEIA